MNIQRVSNNFFMPNQSPLDSKGSESKCSSYSPIPSSQIDDSQILRSLNETSHSLKQLNLDQPDKQIVSKDLLKEYLETIAEADARHASFERVSLITIGVTILATAALALYCNSLLGENANLKENLLLCQNGRV